MQYSHDIWRMLSSRNLAYNSTGGAAASTTSVGSQTYAVQLSYPGSTSSTGGLHVLIGDAPVADSTSPFLPANWVQVWKITPGQKISAISNDAGTGTLNITELG